MTSRAFAMASNYLLREWGQALKKYTAIALAVLAGFNVFWQCLVFFNRPSLESLEATSELAGSFNKAFVGKSHREELRIGGILVACGASAASGSVRFCPLEDAVPGQFVRAFVVDIPTATEHARVIKSLTLGDGRKYSKSAAEILANWVALSYNLEIQMTEILAAVFGLFGLAAVAGTYLVRDGSVSVVRSKP